MAVHYILAIESSCDETSVALLALPPAGVSAAKILSEEISSQTELHQLYGGVVPELASREHLKNLPLLVDKVLSQAGLEFSQLSAIAVTRGPGLKGCLLIGLDYAKALSLRLRIPLIGINHIEGHVLSALLDNPQLKFPFLCLVVSGGHTEIHKVEAAGNYQLWARTIDDAAGEAFDKSANLLGIAYPGGPKLAALADEFITSGKKPTLNLRLPKVMQEQAGFSFSGLKTAIAMAIRSHATELTQNPEVRAELAYLVQEAIVEALVRKLQQAIGILKLDRVVVTGGVSANRRLRQAVAAIPRVQAFFPATQHCMDNAAMIAYAASWRFLKGENLDARMSALARWPLESLSDTINSQQG